ncbi:flagellar protein FlaG [Rhodothalassium salexigens]|uniref:flagellar protein FlaG n=2 Tax=Rhodothalassium salexigens TaxID=1086 RepID=UPI00311EB9DB
MRAMVDTIPTAAVSNAPSPDFGRPAGQPQPGRPQGQGDTRPSDTAPNAAGRDARATAQGGEPSPGQDNPNLDDRLAEAEAMIAEMTVGLRGEGRFEVVVDEESKRFIYRAVDEQTGEVIRQFPPEAILKAVRAIREFEGLLVDQDA